jgi:hypothetical protein
VSGQDREAPSDTGDPAARESADGGVATADTASAESPREAAPRRWSRPSSGTPAGIITFTLLALLGMFVLRRQTMQEFPDARPGEATHRARAWFSQRRQQRQRGDQAADTSASLTTQLHELSDLRDHGAITSEEHQAAKTQLLHG